MRLLNKGERSGPQRERGLAVFILLLLMVLGWFSVALASSFDSFQTVRYVNFPIEIDSIADYSADPTGIEIPLIDINLIADLVSPETLAEIQSELLESVPVEPVIFDTNPAVKLSLKAAETSIPEPGRSVVYNLTLTNQTAEQITLSSLVESRSGDLARKGCPIRITIEGFGSYSCSYDSLVEGNAGTTVTNLVTASGADNNGSVFSVRAESSVYLADIIPTPSISKTASRLIVNEPGSQVTYTVQVTNSSREPARLVGLEDDLRGDLNGVGSCNSAANPFPANLERGVIYTCSFAAEVMGNAGDMFTASTMVKIQDDEGNLGTASDTVTVSIADLKPSLFLLITANKSTLDEPSGTVIYSIAVTNTSVEPVILTSLDASALGSLNNKGNCSIGGSIQVGATYSCSFPKTITGNAGDILNSAVTATIADDEGNSSYASASAGVKFINVYPTVKITNSVSPGTLAEPGGTLTYTIQGKNTSVENVAVVSLSDDQIGSLAGVGTCGTLANPYPADLTPGDSYQCQYSIPFSGDAGDSYSSTVAIVIQDDEGSSASDSDGETVAITDLLPSITATNQAGSGTINEPGGDITYTVQVENTSVETVTLTSLTDSKFGDLTAKGCVLGPINSGESYICVYTGSVTGDAGDTFTSNVIALAWDNDSNSTADNSSAVVVIADVLPTILVTNQANLPSVDEPGAEVTFAIQVQNTSPESVTLNSLSSDVFGSLDGKGTCASGGVIPTAGTYDCSFTRSISGNGGESKTSIVTATVMDNENNTGSASAAAIVAIADVLPTILVTNQASLPAVDEPGQDLTFTVQVENTSPETVTLTSLTDSKFGDLTAKGCVLGPINSGESYFCVYTGSVTGDAGDTFTSNVIALAWDNDSNSTADNSSAVVVITDVLPTILVTNQASSPSVDEPGQDLTYTVQVENTSVETVTLTSLTDTRFGDLSSRGCLLSSIASGATYSCDFTGPVSGDAGDTFTNTITATAVDNDGNSTAASATDAVFIFDVLPAIIVNTQAGAAEVDEPGQDLTFTVQVENTSPETVTLTSLTDSKFGDLTAKGCVLGPITSGESYFCVYTGSVTGDAGDTFTSNVIALAWDNDSNSTADNSSAVVVIADVLPTIQVTNQASLPSVDEPGAEVTYAIQVQNTSPESVTLNSLSSDVFGSLNGKGTCASGGVIPSGGTYDCSFTRSISGNGGESKTSIVTATVMDNENNIGSASAAADVAINDLDPTITIEKTASKTSLRAPGGIVTFVVVVDNTSLEDLILTSLLDDKYGDLDGQGSCTLPQEIVPGGSYACSFSGMVNGVSGDVHTNIVTASARDDEFNLVTEFDDASVTLINGSPPSFNISKVPGATTIPEPGGMVTFTIQIQNTFGEELQLISLMDDAFGDLDGQGTCSYPREIDDESSYTCAFSANISGNAGLIHTNVVTAELVEEGPTGSQSDSASITITDVLPSLLVTVTPDRSDVVDPGEIVAFTVVIENTSVEDISLISLIDDTFGNLHGQGSCAVDAQIAVGDTYSCTFEGHVQRERWRNQSQHNHCSSPG